MNIKTVISRATLKKGVWVFISFAFFIIMLCILTVVSYYSDMDYELIKTLSYVLLCAGLFSAGAGAGFLSEKAGWLNGLAAALLYLIFVLLTALCVNGSQCDVIGFLIKTPLYLAGGAVCGIIGINLHK